MIDMPMVKDAEKEHLCIFESSGLAEKQDGLFSYEYDAAVSL